MTFIHEIAHHILINKNWNNNEENARGLSHSLFYLATPKLFKKSCEKGLFIFQNTFKENREEGLR